MRDARHVDKFFYTLIEGLFYEPFLTRYQPSTRYTAVVEALLKDATAFWEISREGFWFHVHAEHFDVALQGWKVHVSATPLNAEAILRKVAEIALAKRVPFKFALDENILSMMGSKGWHRGSSGKFITLYPPDIQCFKDLLEQLYPTLRCDVGPYILSDKRYQDCRVLYYRFGGIRRKDRMEITGEKIPILIAPSGEEIPDIRTPYFAPPPWVADPFPDEELQVEEKISLNAGKYIVQRALAFSNSGGVYLAEDRDSGNKVIIKEARANTAVDDNGNDAVARLKKEQAILELLRDTGVTPKPLESFYDWENFFLAEEYIEGVDVRELMLTKTPLMLVKPSLENSSSFYELYTKTFRSFLQTLSTVHAHGVLLGDLSANNIKIDPSTYAVRLIDFEGAFRQGVDHPTPLFTPGFRDPTRQRKGVGYDLADDYYSVAAIMLYTLFPVSSLSSLRADLYDTVLRTVLADVGWSDTQIFNIVNGLSKATITPSRALKLLDIPAQIADPVCSQDVDSDWCDEASQEFADFLLANVQPSKTGGLFPADPFIYQTNTVSLGFGACGVLYALKKCGFEIPECAHGWLEKELDNSTANDLPPGLLTGSSGIAWCLWELGLHDRAIEFMASANGSGLLKRHHSYLYGMAGIGMANLYFYLRTGSSHYLAKANDLADALLDVAQDDDSGVYWETERSVHLGYGYGQSGVALFLLRLSQLSENEMLLSKGKRALDFDLSHALRIEDGVVSFPRKPADSTFEPYLEEGTAGIVKVAIRYGMLEQMETSLCDAWRKYASFAGLFYGLGSFVDVLSDAFVFSGNHKFLDMAKRPIAGIRDLYLIKQARGSATPSDGLFRISCDYATGVAGVLRSLYRFTHRGESDFTLDEVGARETPPELPSIINQSAVR